MPGRILDKKTKTAARESKHVVFVGAGAEVVRCGGPDRWESGGQEADHDGNDCEKDGQDLDRKEGRTGGSCGTGVQEIGAPPSPFRKLGSRWGIRLSAGNIFR